MGRPLADLNPKDGIAGRGFLGRFSGLLVATGILVLCFGRPLYRLARFSFSQDLYSHILLIPFISFYLYWERRRSVPDRQTPDRASATVFSVLGLGCVIGSAMLASSTPAAPIEDLLALEVGGLVFLFIALCFWFLGKPATRSLAFPLGFLLFMAPFPSFLMERIVSGLQLGSAIAADTMFDLVGTPVVFEGLKFRLANITIEVAPECSGIHSSLALLITSFIAAYLFLRSPWKRAVFVLSVIPLALVRNGFRIFTIGELCVHYGAQMINSYIHRHGGPIFFALSLIPFFVLLVLFSQSDRRFGKPAQTPVPQART